MLLVLVGVLGLASVLVMKGKRPSEPVVPVVVENGRVVISMTENGFSPDTITIPAGTIVEFANKDTYWHWPASDPHPTHSFYPEVDSKEPIKPGTSWQVELSKIGKWGIHDHLAPYQIGTIIVTD